MYVRTYTHRIRGAETLLTDYSYAVGPEPATDPCSKSHESTEHVPIMSHIHFNIIPCYSTDAVICSHCSLIKHTKCLN
jgi:hypothetical protein